MKQISIFILLLLLVGCANTEKENISYFQNPNNLVRIPVIEKVIEGQKLSFIIDSGANMSIIDSVWYSNNKNLFEHDSEINILLTGISGVINTKSKIIYTEIDGNYVVFTTSDLSPIINNLCRQGYNIVGILGSDYLQDNNLVIDYYRQAVYSAK